MDRIQLKECKCAILLPEIAQTSSLPTVPHSRRRRSNFQGLPTNIPYRHIPSSAASDFARTATPEPATKEQSHKLSHPIVEELDTVSPFEEQLNQIPLSKKQSRLLNDSVEAEGGRKELLLRRRVTQKTIHQRKECSPSADDCCLELENDDGVHEVSKQTNTSRRPVTLPNPLDRPDWTEKDECTDIEASIISAKTFFSPNSSKQSTSDLFSTGNPASVIRQQDMFDGDEREHMSDEDKKAYSWNCIHFLRR